jgi:septal ring factor EnvC (AmiA/AmiB activator)
MSAPEIGHNKGPELAGDPEDLTILQNKVRREHSETFDRIDYLTQKFAEIPKVIETEDEQGVAQEIFKSMRAIISKAEKERRSAQEPHERRVAVIMATFKKPSDALGGLKDALSLRIDDYLKRKKERAEIEAKRKAAEERLEAERKARAAERARPPPRKAGALSRAPRRARGASKETVGRGGRAGGRERPAPGR